METILTRTLTDEDKLEAVVTEIERRGIAFCEDYPTWTRCALALAAGLGERGREYFHRLSRLDGKYREAECQRKYDNALRTARGSGLGTLFKMAKDEGIDLAEVYKKAQSDPYRSSKPAATPVRAAKTAPQATLATLPVTTSPSAQRAAERRKTRSQTFSRGGSRSRRSEGRSRSTTSAATRGERSSRRLTLRGGSGTPR